MIDLLNNTFIESVQNTNENYNKHFHNTYSIGLTYRGVIKVKYANKTVDSYEYRVQIKICTKADTDSLIGLNFSFPSPSGALSA